MHSSSSSCCSTTTPPLLLVDWARGATPSSLLLTDGLLSTCAWWPQAKSHGEEENLSAPAAAPLVAFPEHAPRTVRFVEIFWGTGATLSSSTASATSAAGYATPQPPDLLVTALVTPGTGKLKCARRDCLVVPPVPPEQMRRRLPEGSTGMARTRHAFETNKSLTLYRLPPFVGASVVSLSLLLAPRSPTTMTAGAGSWPPPPPPPRVCIRAIRAWGPLVLPLALPILCPPRHCFMASDSSHPHEHVGPERIRMHVHMGEQCARFLGADVPHVLHMDGPGGALAVSTRFTGAASSAAAAASAGSCDEFLSEHHSMWRLILSFLTWMELKGNVPSVSREMRALADVTWLRDCAPHKRWCEFGSCQRLLPPCGGFTPTNTSVGSLGLAAAPAVDANNDATTTTTASESCVQNMQQRFRYYTRNLLYHHGGWSDDDDDGGDDQAQYYSSWPTTTAEVEAAAAAAAAAASAEAKSSSEEEKDDDAEADRPRRPTILLNRLRVTTGKKAATRRRRRHARRRRLAFQQRHVDARVAASSRWSISPQEDPQNLVDGDPHSWFSSADTSNTVQIIIDLARPLPVERVVLYWGDDNGRIRPCSKRFAVQVRGRAFGADARHKMSNGTLFHSTIAGSKSVLERERDWRTVYVQNKTIEIVRPPFGHVSEEGAAATAADTAQDHSLRWVETPGVTTTTIDLAGGAGERAVAAVRIMLFERQLYWNNHALQGVEMWGQVRRGDV